MKVLLRADASLQIGTGHIMRCLTLADALAAKGAECQFICRAHKGNLIEFIRSKGYVCQELPISHEHRDSLAATYPDASTTSLTHSRWLGATQSQDAEACAPILAAQRPDWLIVDHYALDAFWEHALAAQYGKLMVIDDLADRTHACDLLLDQTFGRNEADYRSLVPASCRLLCGSQYALLRPAFAALRPYSLNRRAQQTGLRELLISMGGVDNGNATGLVLHALRTCPLPTDCRVTVVMGSTAPWLEQVRATAHDMPWPTRVLVGVSDMAQLMADSDLAIGAAGATAWERCCLGVPTIMIVLAENQLKIALGLEQFNAAKLIMHTERVPSQLRELLLQLIEEPTKLLNISERSAMISDGLGVNAVAQKMEF